jgi:hypothetical protein
LEAPLIEQPLHASVASAVVLTEAHLLKLFELVVRGAPAANTLLEPYA